MSREATNNGNTLRTTGPSDRYGAASAKASTFAETTADRSAPRPGAVVPDIRFRARGVKRRNRRAAFVYCPSDEGSSSPLVHILQIVHGVHLVQLDERERSERSSHVLP